MNLETTDLYYRLKMLFDPDQLIIEQGQRIGILEEVLSYGRIVGIGRPIIYKFRTTWEKALIVFEEVLLPMVVVVVSYSPYRNIRRKEKRKKSAYIIASVDKVLSIG